MTALEQELNELLVHAYNSIEVLEEHMLVASAKLHLSINEIHLLQAVEDSRGDCTIGGLSQTLGVRPPSVTAAVNKLAAKGYVEKCRSPQDGRVVYVLLTKLGRKATRAHRYFHTRMVRAITHSLTGEEQKAMFKGVRKLNGFLDQEIKGKGDGQA